MMSAPTRLVVAYDDGSTKEVDFGDLSDEMQRGLAELGLAPVPEAIGSAKQYLLMKWRDGWQEVVGLDKEKAELLRYYVIQRIEDRGRLSLDVGADYPELLIVERTPRDLNAALLVNEAGATSYSLDTETERWEGIFNAGGKLEFLKYDKTSPQLPHNPDATTAGLEELLASIREALAKRELSAPAVLAMDEPARIETYKELARAAGLRGSERQADVYGFVELLLRRLR
jgi:hypothetical protein